MSCLLCLGFWQLGQGAYIPAKAWLAQELMQRAWQKTQDGESESPPWPWADTWPVARLLAKGGDIELIVLRTRTSERQCTARRERQQHYRGAQGYALSVPAIPETR
jgi:hypothetical protein